MYNLLIIDDEPFIIHILETYIESFDFKIFTADDTYVAEDILENNNIDLIITDNVMPIRSGFEFIKVIRENEKYKNQKILVMSAKQVESDLELAKKYNIDGYILKPFEMQELLKKINEILKKDL